MRRLEEPRHTALVPARTAGHRDVTKAAAAPVRFEGRATAAGSPADLSLPGADAVAVRAAPGPVIEHLYRHEVVMPAAAAAEPPGSARRGSGQPARRLPIMRSVSPGPCRAPGGRAGTRHGCSRPNGEGRAARRARGTGSRSAPGSTPGTSRSPPAPVRSGCTARATRSAPSRWPDAPGNWSHGLRPHRARHTFATRLRQGGADPAQVQALLGHASIDTAARYFRAGSAEKAEVIERVFSD